MFKEIAEWERALLEEPRGVQMLKFVRVERSRVQQGEPDPKD